MEKAGYTGNDPNHVGLQTRAGRTHVIIIGPNCALLDAQGRLVWCASQDFAVKRLEKDGTQTVLADNFEGKHFNGPNDIAIKSDGAIYIADSDVGLRDGARSPLKQMPNHVWLWKDGKVTMALSQEKLGASPNGVVLSLDEKSLYLTAGRKLMKYEVKADDTLGEGTLVAEGEGITDGMKIDTEGQHLLDQRRRARRHPHHVARRQAPRLPEPSDRRRSGTQAADLRHQPGIRRRWPRSVCFGVRRRLQDPAGDARHHLRAQRRDVVGREAVASAFRRTSAGRLKPAATPARSRACRRNRRPRDA